MRAVARAVEALLDGHPLLHVRKPGEALPPTGAPVYDTLPDLKPTIYATYYLSSPARGRARLDASSELGLWTLTTLCVGPKPDECRWVAESIHAALELGRLDMPGRHMTPITLGTAGQLRADSSVNPPVTVLTDVWRFRLTK